MTSKFRYYDFKLPEQRQALNKFIEVFDVNEDNIIITITGLIIVKVTYLRSDSKWRNANTIDAYYLACLGKLNSTQYFELTGLKDDTYFDLKRVEE